MAVACLALRLELSSRYARIIVKEEASVNPIGSLQLNVLCLRSADGRRAFSPPT